MRQAILKYVIYALLIVVALVVLVALIRFFEFEATILNILAWVQDSPWLGLLVLSALLVAFVLFMLPSVLLTVGAGFLFGVWAGSLLVVTAETIGAALAFAIARFGAPQKLKAYLINLKYYPMIDGIVIQQGWRVVAATRMIPFFPFKLSNYLYGVTNVSAKNYVLGTFIGLWPISVFNAYVGTLAADIFSIGTANAPTAQAWLLSLLLLFALLLIIRFIVKKQKLVYSKWTKGK